MMDDRDMTDDTPTDPIPPTSSAPAALRALDDVVAPDRLRMAVAEMAAEAQRATRRWPRLLRRGTLRFAAAAAVPLVTVLAFAFAAQRVIGPGHGSPSPSARDVAAVALRPAAAAAPATLPGGELLRAHAGPIAFPTWTRNGWHAIGARTDTVGGHALRTVFYADAAGRRIGYAIADAALPVGGGRDVTVRGQRLRVLDRGATSVVTWRRDGRTCVLAGRGVAVGRLLTLASYAA